MLLIRRMILAVGLLGLPAILGFASAWGDEPRLNLVEPEARRLLGDVAKAYRELPVVDAEGELTLAVTTIQGKARRDVFPMIVRYARPDKVVLVHGPVRLISDGKTLHTVVEPLRQYSSAEAPKAVTFDTLRSSAAMGPLFGGIHGFPLFLLVALATEEDAAKTLTMGVGGMKLEEDRKIDGKVYRCLFADWPRGTGYRILVDPDSKLIARIEMVHAMELANEDAPKGKTLSQLDIHWDAKLKAGALAGDAFTFQAPKGFNEVAERAVLERPLAPGEIRVPAEFEAGVLEAMEASKALVGKPSPDFVVTVLDGAGKTKTIRKKDLAGRVVVVVIWPASVGEPFPGEMAALPALAESYRKADAKVTFLFLPQDNRPGDAATIREHVEDAIKSKGLKIPVGDVGRVVLDPELAISQAFHATALPTLVVIDGEGVVRAVDSGFGEKVQETYRRKIDDLLAKKE